LIAVTVLAFLVYFAADVATAAGPNSGWRLAANKLFLLLLFLLGVALNLRELFLLLIILTVIVLLPILFGLIDR